VGLGSGHRQQIQEGVEPCGPVGSRGGLCPYWGHNDGSKEEM